MGFKKLTAFLVLTFAFGFWAKFGQIQALAPACQPVCRSEPVTCFVHITDTHVDQQSWYPGRLKNAIDYFNRVVQPPFILHTGDTVDNANSVAFSSYINAIRDSSSPVCTVPGNHDQAGDFQYFLDNIAPADVSFDCNSYRFVGFNSQYLYGVLPSGKTRIEWLKEEVENFTFGKTIIFGHFPVECPSADLPHCDPNGATDFQVKLRSLILSRGTLAYLSGHLHTYFVFYNPNMKVLDIGGNAFRNDPSPDNPGKYGLVCLDKKSVSSRLVSVGQTPLIIITNPEEYISQGGRGKVSGRVKIRARTFSAGDIVSVSGRIDSGAWTNFTSLSENLWELTWESSTVGVGEHAITARATDSAGQQFEHQINVWVEATPTPGGIPGDYDNNGRVDQDDLQLLLDSWQENEADLTILLANWTN